MHISLLDADIDIDNSNTLDSAHRRMPGGTKSDKNMQQGASIIMACAHANQPARFVSSESDCKKKEKFYAWNIEGSTGQIGEDGADGAGCKIFKSGDAATVTCGEESVEISDGNAGIQGPAGASCNIAKDGDATTLTCGQESIEILDGQAGLPGPAGTRCNAKKENGVSTVTCGEDSVEILDGETIMIQGLDGNDGASCGVAKANGISTINCGEDSVEIFDGETVTGPPGIGCTVNKEQEGLATITCGADSVNIVDGVNGREGKPGAPGPRCSVTKTKGTAKIECGGDYVEVLDGADGVSVVSEMDMTGKKLTLNSITTTLKPELEFTGDTGGGAEFESRQPSLGLNYIIRAEGDIPMVGEIRIFAGDTAPVGWLLCDGGKYKSADNPSLYNVIGTMYSPTEEGDPTVPDLRGRVAIGAGTRIPYLNRSVVLAAQFGSFMAKLDIKHLPAHEHAFAQMQSISGTVSVTATE